MKMADGDFRPAYNAQLASDCDAQVIVGVGVVTTPDQVGRRPGADMAQLAPGQAEGRRRWSSRCKDRCGRLPGPVNIGCASHGPHGDSQRSSPCLTMP